MQRKEGTKTWYKFRENQFSFDATFGGKLRANNKQKLRGKLLKRKKYIEIYGKLCSGRLRKNLSSTVTLTALITISEKTIRINVYKLLFILGFSNELFIDQCFVFLIKVFLSSCLNCSFPFIKNSIIIFRLVVYFENS